jgi:Zn-dependent protease with chaperone function
MEKTTVPISGDVYKGVRMLKAELSAKKEKALTWDEFFELQLSRERKKKDLTSWIYTLGIFVAITFIFMFPFYIGAPLAAMAMLPVFILIGLIVAFFSAYVLTSWTLRGIKPFEKAPSEILKSFEEPSRKAGLEKHPELMIAETPEINAMAYVCLSGNRICVTRGLLNAYQNENIDEEDLNAILGHEIGHIRNLEIFCKIASILAFHLSRKHEHAADMVGAELTSPETMANALQRINTLNKELAAKELATLPYADRWQLQPRNPSLIDKLFDTHPPMEKRETDLKTISKFL